MIDGQGDPNTSADYAAGRRGPVHGVLHGEVHGQKGPEERDYAVMPLEGLWWADDLAAFHSGDRASWRGR